MAPWGFCTLAASQASRTSHAVERKGSVGHADINKLPFTGLLAMNHRCEYAHNCVVGTARHICNLDAHGWWPAFFTTTMALTPAMER